jgi:hypothetical protein
MSEPYMYKQEVLKELEAMIDSGTFLILGWCKGGNVVDAHNGISQADQIYFLECEKYHLIKKNTTQGIENDNKIN